MELPFSFSTSLSPNPIQFPKPRNATPRLRRISAVATDPSQELPQNSPQRLLKELAVRKRPPPRAPRAPPRRFVLTPPLDDKRVASRFLNSPQLALNSFPLLSSCLPFAPLAHADSAWMERHLMEAKHALGYPLEPSAALPDGNPAKELDTLLYLAFQHERSRARHVRFGHSRLFFLGQYVLELAFAEFFLQRYPRESPAPLRERVFGLIGKRSMARWIKAASLHNLVFPCDDMDKLIRKERESTVKSVFWALFGAIYLCFGMPEVYRVLFEVFGMDPDAEDCQPKLRRQLEDIDHVSAEFEGNISWQDMPPADALFAHPRLFRACVPPGMHRFRGNLWDYDCRPQIMQVLGYPLEMTDRIPEITKARNIELDLGLQLCFLHPSKYKFEHPRFCYERLEYLGQKIQDLVMAERLLMKHLDAPGFWLQNRHRRFLMNKFCGRYLRAKNLHRFIIYSEKVDDIYQRSYRLKYPVTTAVQQAIHGLSYAVYGKRDVRRLMFEVFDFEQTQPEAL
uniref:Ribonuclease III domain-containing protein RNC1, chloroplastic n=1 Tax=Cajanus cajan TaxID=3821 RepID=A0A151TWQ0_CAJCA|nr:Ribonuclease 3 [Cajanus cajan]